MSAHLAIQTGVIAALAAAPAVAGGLIRANASRPLPASASSAVVVRLAQSRAVNQLLGGPIDWTTTLQIECLARAASGSADPVAAVDALLETVWARLATLPAASLGAMDVRVAPAIDWQIDDSETPAVAATITLQVMHRTQSAALTAWT